MKFSGAISIQGRLRVRGPGTIIFGRNIEIGSNTDIYTHSPQAVVIIGDNTFLNGTRFGVVERVEIGHNCILADARIMDTDFHSLYKDRRSSGAVVAVAPVIVEENVWIAAGAALLKGVRIGENSVVGFGAVVTKDVAANTIVAGNPAKPVGAVPDGERDSQ